MHKHVINCRVEGSKSIDDIQYKINKNAALHIIDALQHSGISREGQIQILSRLIEELKKQEVQEVIYADHSYLQQKIKVDR